MTSLKIMNEKGKDRCYLMQGNLFLKFKLKN
jgi:hypothetical protein